MSRPKLDRVALPVFGLRRTGRMRVCLSDLRNGVKHRVIIRADAETPVTISAYESSRKCRVHEQKCRIRG